MNSSETIQKHLDDAYDIAIREVEKLARQTLYNNPAELKTFVMGMGTYYFTDMNDEVIHVSMADNDKFLKSLPGYNQLVSFIIKWDHELRITGEPMRFTVDGPMKSDW